MQCVAYGSEYVGVNIHTELQDGFLRRIEEKGIDTALEWLMPQKDGSELTRPEPLRLEWSGEIKAPYTLEIWEEGEPSEALRVTTDDHFFDLTNLKIGQGYFWRVNGGETCRFETEDNKFRFIDVGGALNVRDLGGINIKQGLLFRGSEIDKEYVLTEKGRDALCNGLKIRTQVDLRKESERSEGMSCIGEGVRYKPLPYRPYLEMFMDEHRRGLCNIMEFFADESNYPIYFHCLGGADRTGMISLIVRALMGESDEDIFTDYELTSLSSYAYGHAEGVRALGFRSRNSDYFREFVERLGTFGKDTLAQNAEAFVLECGVPPEVVEMIRSILSRRTVI